MVTYSILNPITNIRDHLVKREEKRDLGVVIDEGLRFHSHIQHVVSQENSMLGLLKRTISSQEATIFIKLFRALVRPHLDFGMCQAGPSYQQDGRLIENVQRQATKCKKSLKSASYEEQLKLPTLVYRCLCSDMMLTFNLHHLQGQPQYQPSSYKRTFKEATKIRLQIKNLSNVFFKRSN
jgi:hypothetical protein